MHLLTPSLLTPLSTRTARPSRRTVAGTGLMAALCQAPWPRYRNRHLECGWHGCPVSACFLIQFSFNKFLPPSFSCPMCCLSPLLPRFMQIGSQVCASYLHCWRLFALVASYSSALEHQPLIRLMSPIATALSSRPHKTDGSLSCCFPKPRTDRPPRWTQLANQ